MKILPMLGAEFESAIEVGEHGCSCRSGLKPTDEVVGRILDLGAWSSTG